MWARRQEVHDLVRRDTHQAQLRQTLKYDRAIQPREFVWVFCHHVPQKGSPKLKREWCGAHKIVYVLQEGCVYVVDTGQKVNFERLKPHQSSPLEPAAVPTDGGDIVVLMDPEPECSAEIITDAVSQPSYKTEQLLSEASDVSLPSRERHLMDTQLQTDLRAGGSHMHYQQFASSTDGTDDEMTDVMLPIPLHPPDADQVKPTAPTSASDSSISIDDQLPQLFSDQKRVPSPSSLLTASEKGASLPGTSAPLLTNPSLTDYFSNYPIWPTESRGPAESDPVDREH